MKKKNLVLYFSTYGTAKKTAEEIAKQADADLVEIEPVQPYDSNRDHYDALAAFTKQERGEDRRPAIKNKLDLEGYENIFIGYPIWWYTLPMILYTLFDEYDFTGKTIIPFNTHMGSGDGGTYRTIQQLEPGAKVLKGLPLEMQDAERGNPKAVSRWLAKLGLKAV
jgi:flavodoxin